MHEEMLDQTENASGQPIITQSDLESDEDDTTSVISYGSSDSNITTDRDDSVDSDFTPDGTDEVRVINDHFVYVHGRFLNRLSHLYLWPCKHELSIFVTNTKHAYVVGDSFEYTRQDVVHKMLKSAIGGLYFAESDILRIISPKKNQTTSILDIGSGNGSWAISMANTFPFANVLGLDLAPFEYFVPK